jgi:alpha-tubulin suppressor-like RCC1 family protein
MGGTEAGSGGTSTGGNSGTGGTSTSTGGFGTGGRATGGNSGTGGSDEPECAPRRRVVGDECLLVEGEECESHGECASGNCADGVCCNVKCDRLCERCNAPDEPGTCTVDEGDGACQAPRQCTDRSRCRLPDGQTCSDGSACDSNHCKQTNSGAMVCCETACDGTCEKCSPDGMCSDYPTTDNHCGPAACDPDTRCVTYDPPAPNACSDHGECAGCKANYERARVPCGVGSQCDGAGKCEVTGRGRVAAGERHTCAINGDANVICWGDNRFGQLGAAFGRPRVGFDEEPFLVPDLVIDFEHNVVQIAAGTQHTCALFDTGEVRCWGTMYNHPTFGQIFSIWGTIEVAFVRDSVALAPPYGFIDPLNTGNVILAEPAEQISAAPEGATICALLRSGNISCWGSNLFGQLGLGHRNPLSVAQLEVLPIVDLAERVVEVRSGFAHTCALTESGGVHCWGDGLYGRLGSGNSEPRYSPTTVDIGEPAVGITAGFDHTCALLARGRVRCWGNNHQGQLGYGHTLAIGDDETPAEAVTKQGPAGREFLGGDVALDVEMDQVMTFPASSRRSSSGIWDSSPTCALSTGKFVRCWGRNDVGQLGYGHNLAGATEHTPVELGDIRVSDMYVVADGEVLALSEGGRCALCTDGDIYCWGANDHGQVGVPGNALPSVTQRPLEIGPVHWWAQ